MLAVVTACQPFRPGDRVDLPGGTPPVDRQIATDEALADAIDTAVLDFLGGDRVPGMGVTLTLEGAVVFAGGYGWADIESGRAMKADTPIMLASVSKTFIGVAAMKAVQAGALTLDDRIDDLVGFRVDNPRVDGETIRLRDLLTHTSGIEDTRMYDRATEAGDPAISLGDFVRGYLTRGGDHWRRRNYGRRQPGEEFSYSNVAAATAAYGIATVQDTTFKALVNDQILQPLGMNDSAYFLEDLETSPATPYKTVRRPGRFRPWPQYGYPTYADGMLRATAADMGHYLAAISYPGPLRDALGLTEASIDEMLTVDSSVATDGDAQAIVWAMTRADGHELFGHDGGDYGSSAEMWIDREHGIGVSLVLNTEVGDETWEQLSALQAELFELARAQ